MDRIDLLRSPEYWISQIQIALYNVMEEYRNDNGLTKTQLAEKMGVTKGYISQILNGDFDHKISKLVNTALTFNKVPFITFVDIESVIKNEQNGTSVFNQINAVLYCHAYNAKSELKIKNEEIKRAYKLASTNLEMQPFTTFNALNN